jgi:hypothetical protein
MGKTHVFGFATALKVFDLPFDIELRTVADVTEAPPNGRLPSSASPARRPTGGKSSSIPRSRS